MQRLALLMTSGGEVLVAQVDGELGELAGDARTSILVGAFIGSDLFWTGAGIRKSGDGFVFSPARPTWRIARRRRAGEAAEHRAAGEAARRRDS